MLKSLKDFFWEVIIIPSLKSEPNHRGIGMAAIPKRIKRTNFERKRENQKGIMSISTFYFLLFAFYF